MPPGGDTGQRTRWSPLDLLKQRGYQVGLQMMVGLPEDDDDGAMETARRIAELQPDFVRIYPTLVLKGSGLARTIQRRSLSSHGTGSLCHAGEAAVPFFQHPPHTGVRMGLQASDGLTRAGDFIAGPYHPAFGHLVHGEIVLDAISSALDRMEKPAGPPDHHRPSQHGFTRSRPEQTKYPPSEATFDLKKIVAASGCSV
jgi:histone acetyltransferase (RNA polymerase elongator complex component)